MSLLGYPAADPRLSSSLLVAEAVEWSLFAANKQDAGRAAAMQI
jgi:hypothetical protein